MICWIACIAFWIIAIPFFWVNAREIIFLPIILGVIGVCLCIYGMNHNKSLLKQEQEKAMKDLQNFEQIRENEIQMAKRKMEQKRQRLIDALDNENQGQFKHMLHNASVPKCPTCGSTNVAKIGTGERVASVAGVGILSNKINKTFKCKNCGYMW